MQYVEKKTLNKVYMTQQTVLPVVYDRRVKKTVVGGVEIVELKGMFVPRIEKLEREVLFQQQPILFPFVNNKRFEMLETVEEEQQLLNQLKHEYVQYYVEECKRIAKYIVKKVVEPTMITMIEEPIMTIRPVPHTLKHLINKIKCERKLFQHCPILTAIVEGGQFLQFLQTIVEEIQLVQQQEECMTRRVKYVFGHKNIRFFQTLEKDVLLSLVNVKPHFVQLFKNILEQEIVMPRQPWTTTVVEPRMSWTNTIVEPCQPWTNTIVEPRMHFCPEFTMEQRMEQLEIAEPRLRLFRSPSELRFPKYL
jgi:hypothetical protein